MRTATCRPLFLRSSQSANADINVTPLVDVVLVLLIIFMTLTPLLERDIEVRTPASERDPSTEAPPDQIVVSLRTGRRLRLNAEAVDAAALRERLARVLGTRAEADRIVFVVAEDECSYGELVEVLDIARGAGAVTLGVPTDAPDPQFL
jgi:biopolymer transport protein TolR